MENRCKFSVVDLLDQMSNKNDDFKHVNIEGCISG